MSGSAGAFHREERGTMGRNTAARVTFIPRLEEERTMGNPRNYRNHPSTNLTEGGGEDVESLEENSRAGIMLTPLSKDSDAVFRSNRGRGQRGSPPRCIRREIQLAISRDTRGLMSKGSSSNHT